MFFHLFVFLLIQILNVNYGIYLFCFLVFSFKVEPSDVLVAGGASVLLDCAADDKAIRNLEDNDVNIRWRGPDGQDIGIVGDTFR